jgi:hypothetical protein
MKHFDKYLLWLGRIISLPMAGICFYFVWSEINKARNGKVGDGSIVLIFTVCGTFCIAYFIALLQIKSGGNDDKT